MPIASMLMVSAALLRAATVKDCFFTTSDGVKLHYLESGSGPTILFVPGWTMPAEIWQPQIEYFRTSYHVVAVDPRSQGASDKPAEGNYPGRRAQDYKELIDHLAVSSIFMVAWSIAVYEALTFVQMFGTGKLNGLVLVDLKVYTPSLAEDREHRYDFFHDFQVDRKLFTRTFVRGMYHQPQAEDYLESITTASLQTPTPTAVALLAELAMKNDIRPALPEINIPVLAAMTKANRSIADLITSSVPGSEAEVFEDSGHCLFVDDADRFNTVVESFLQKASLGSGK